MPVLKALSILMSGAPVLPVRVEMKFVTQRYWQFQLWGFLPQWLDSLGSRTFWPAASSSCGCVESRRSAS